MISAGSCETEVTLVKNQYTWMYLKYIYFMLSILQIHFHIYVLNKMPCNCIISILNWYT